MKRMILLCLAAVLLFLPMGLTAQQSAEEPEELTLEEEIYQLIDEYRQKAKAPSLLPLEDLQRAAEIRAWEIAESFSTKRPDGSKNSTVYEGDRVLYAEMIWKGPYSAKSAVRTFYNSDTNKKIMLSRKYTHVGIGVYEGDEKMHVAILLISVEDEAE